MSGGSVLNELGCGVRLSDLSDTISSQLCDDISSSGNTLSTLTACVWVFVRKQYKDLEERIETIYFELNINKLLDCCAGPSRSSGRLPNLAR